MRRGAAVKEFATWLGTPYHRASRLLTLGESAYEEQVTEMNTGHHDSSFADKFEQLANSLGYAVQWPGLYPVLFTEAGDPIYLPDYEEEFEVEAYQTLKRFQFPFADYQARYFHTGGGAWVHEDLLGDFHDACEKYSDRIDANRVVESLFDYIPGLQECGGYGDYTLLVDMDELEEGFWSEEVLEYYLRQLCEHVEMRRAFHSEYEPYNTPTRDAYGNGMTRRNYSGFLPPATWDLPECMLVRQISPRNADSHTSYGKCT